MSILVFTENWDGKFKKLSFELVSYASKLSEMLNTSTIAMSIGTVSDDELKKLGKYGAEKVILASGEGLNVLDTQAWVNIISDVAEKENATIIVFSNNITGKAIAPRLSVRMKAGLGAGVSGLPVSTDPFVVYKKVYSGNAFADVLIRSEKKIITLQQNSFELIEKPVNPEILNLPVVLEPGTVKTQVKDVQKQTGKILLTDAEVVVSGGRGMKSPDNWGAVTRARRIIGSCYSTAHGPFLMRAGGHMRNMPDKQERLLHRTSILPLVYQGPHSTWQV